MFVFFTAFSLTSRGQKAAGDRKIMETIHNLAWPATGKAAFWRMKRIEYVCAFTVKNSGIWIIKFKRRDFFVVSIFSLFLYHIIACKT